MALPLSALELNSSVIAKLDLSSAQVESIEQLMSEQQRTLVPLMAQMQQTKERLLSADELGQTSDNKEVKALAATQAHSDESDRRQFPNEDEDLPPPQPNSTKEARWLSAAVAAGKKFRLLRSPQRGSQDQNEEPYRRWKQ